MELKTFTMRIEGTDLAARIFFSGTLNEEAYSQMSKLADSLPKTCTFDFGGVGFINSTGVRDWIKFIRQIQPGRTLYFENCTDCIIGNINLMPYMLGTAEIKSVLRNCTCPKCGALDAIRLTAGTDYSKEGFLLSTIPHCRVCQTSISWDMNDSEYFLFQRPS